jgi:hypothetical protein
MEVQRQRHYFTAAEYRRMAEAGGQNLSPVALPGLELTVEAVRRVLGGSGCSSPASSGEGLLFRRQLGPLDQLL